MQRGGLPLLDLPHLTPKITQMKGSKKGACSSNTQTAKANCLAHNRRDNSTEKVPSYVNKNRSHLNRIIFEDDIIKGRKSIVPLVHAAEKLYTEKTGQKCQKSFAPFREACLHLKEGITNEQLIDFKAKVEQETKWKVIGIYLHEDEGHAKSKYIEGEEGFEINHHAHVLFSCQDLNTGKAIRADRKKLSKMQDILAEATGMERGNKASETGRRHRSAMEQRLYAQEQRIAELEAKATEKQEEKAKLYDEIDLLRNYIESKEKELSVKEERLETMKISIEKRQEIQQLQEEVITKSNNIIDQLEKEYKEKDSIISERKEELKGINTSLSERKKELEKVNLSLSEGLDRLSGVNAEVHKQKAVRERINAEISDFTARQAQQIEEYNKKAQQIEQLNEGIEIAKEFDHRINTAFQSIDDSESLWGVKKYEAVQKECEKFNTELKNRCMRIEKLIDQAIECTFQCIKDMSRKAYTEQEVSVINAALGKQRREERAMAILYAAEEDAGVRHGYYAGCAIWERDLRAIARGESVNTELDRGRGIGY